MRMTGFTTLLRKEILRFWRVGAQTLFAPIITAILYQLIFSHAASHRVNVLPGVNYGAFLIPGLAMMTMMQNSFSNASSSLIQSRLTGNLVFILLPPISHFTFFSAYVTGGIVRGFLVGIGVIVATAWFFGLPIPSNILWILTFAVLGCTLLAVFGLLVGILAETFDRVALFQNFVIMPLTFLSGVFYSIHSLPSIWRTISHLNPVFYLVDGFRYGFFGHSDVSPWLSLAVSLVAVIGLSAIALKILRSEHNMRS